MLGLGGVPGTCHDDLIVGHVAEVLQVWSRWFADEWRGQGGGGSVDCWRAVSGWWEEGAAVVLSLMPFLST